MINIVHVTPHLGGGVGKAISGLILADKKNSGLFRHSVIALEALEKRQSLEMLLNVGVDVYEEPNALQIESLLKKADIIQIEFWNHPLIPKLLCSSNFPMARVVFWCHISGLATPCIPSEIIDNSHQFIFTSACSWNSPNISRTAKSLHDKVEVISSAGGLELLPKIVRSHSLPLRFGYFGSLNFSKMHPDFVRYVSAIEDPLLEISMVGDELNANTLKSQIQKIGRPGLLHFLGHQTDIVKTLMSMDVLIYLLNPTHYGTAENALIEAMAMGVIPIVMNNSAEKEIIKHGDTGFVIRTPNELRDIVKIIGEDSGLRKSISLNAVNYARKNFTYSNSVIKFNSVYQKVMLQDKKLFDYKLVFGLKPYEWFLAFQAKPSTYSLQGSVNLSLGHAVHSAYENSKGSVFHFHKYFSDDTMLNLWVGSLERVRKI